MLERVGDVLTPFTMRGCGEPLEWIVGGSRGACGVRVREDLLVLCSDVRDERVRVPITPPPYREGTESLREGDPWCRECWVCCGGADDMPRTMMRENRQRPP